MRLKQQTKYQKEIENYISTLKPEAVKFINSKRMINLCNRVIKLNSKNPFQEIIIRDILIEKYGLLINGRMIRQFLESKEINFNKRKFERKKKRRQIKTNENILSIKY